MRRPKGSTKPPTRAELCGGFTLLEILITLVIIGVLSGLAVFFYGSSVRRVETAEAIVNMSAIRQAEHLKREEIGSYLSASDTDAINRLLGLEIQAKLFTYKIVDADGADFMIIAERISGALFGAGITGIAMNSAGIITSIGLEGGVLGAAGGGGGGDSGGSGGGSGGFGSSSGSGGGSGGSGGGGSGGSGGTEVTFSTGGASFPDHNWGAEFGCPYSSATLAYIERCDDIFTGWNVGAQNVAPNLDAAFDMIAALPPFNAITDDLVAKGLSVEFGLVSDFTGAAANAYAFFRHAVDPGLGSPPGAHPLTPVIMFNPNLMGVETGVLAAILVHEATHFQDYLYGLYFNDNICFKESEFRAFWNEAAFWNQIRGTCCGSLDSNKAEKDLETTLVFANRGEAQLRDLIDQNYTNPC